MLTTLDQHTALVIIDMQKGILRMNPPGLQPVIENVMALTKAFHKLNKPVIAVHVLPLKAPGVINRAESRGPVASALPADFAEYIPEVGVLDSDIHLTKHTWSAFYDTELHEQLQAHSVTNVVLCGVSTSIGVEGTARAAAERGYNISFAVDAMTDMNPPAHEHSTTTIFPRLGERGSTAEVLALLLVGSSVHNQ